MLQGFTCGCSRGTEEAARSGPAVAELGCKAEGRGTSRSRRCMEVEDLKLAERI